MDPVNDLGGLRTAVDAQSGDYPTGAWGDESRDYFVSIRVNPGAVGDEMLAGRVTLMVGGQPAGTAHVKAVWTDDQARSTRINRRVAEVMGETELADEIQAGVEAYREGDLETSTNRFARAVQMAAEAGNQDALGRLAGLVEIDDAPTGRVRPKARVEKEDVMTLETRSTLTKRTRR
jgi:hypothetical protein